MRLIPFEPSHLDLLRPGPFDSRAMGARLEDPGIAFTAVEGGHVLGCGGIIARERTGLAWLLLSPEMRARPVTLHRLASRALAAGFRILSLTRIEATVHADFAAGQRWLERLGFRRAEKLEKYGPLEEEYLRYVRC